MQGSKPYNDDDDLLWIRHVKYKNFFYAKGS